MLRAQISRTINVTYQSHLQVSISLTLQEEIDMFSESSVTNYRPTPRYFPEVRRPQQHHGGSLKSGMTFTDSKFGAVLDFLNALCKKKKDLRKTHKLLLQLFAENTERFQHLYSSWNLHCVEQKEVQDKTLVSQPY